MEVTLSGDRTVITLEIDESRVVIDGDGQVLTPPPSFVSFVDPDDREPLTVLRVLDHWYSGTDHILDDMGVRVLGVSEEGTGRLSRSREAEERSSARMGV